MKPACTNTVSIILNLAESMCGISFILNTYLMLVHDNILVVTVVAQLRSSTLR